MKKLMMMGAVVALSLGVASAYATQNDGGFYIGAKGGYNDISIPKTISNTTDTDTYVVNIHAGYLYPVADQFQLGGQVGYSYYGQQKSSDTVGNKLTEKWQSLNLQVVGQYNIEQWFVQGRVGAARVNVNVTDNISGLDSPHGNKWKAIAGASAGYYFTENFSAEIFYDHLFGTDITTSNYATGVTQTKVPTMNSVGIGVSYSF